MKVLFSVAVLANAALIFWVELLYAKALLPSLGGSPAVWNACLMFFQVVLLAGYAYAVLLDRLDLRRQVALHGVVVAIAVAAVPFALFLRADPPTEAPVPWLLALLGVAVGPPFFVLTAGAPVLQRWFSLSGDREAGDPYFLYAASNLGSFAALAAFPLLLEPAFPVDRQTALWKGAFAVVGLLVLGCGVRAVRGTGPGKGTERGAEGTSVAEAREDGSAGGAAAARKGASSPSMARRLRWLGLAFLPSSLLLGVTTHITSEIAPVPLLWVVPLAIYLLTFVVAFGPARGAGGDAVGTGADAARDPSAPGGADRAGSGQGDDLPGRARRRRILAAAAAVAVAIVAWVLLGPRVGPGWILIGADLAILLGAGLLCHTRIARDRPEPSRLAEFYLWVALGGALGGVFNTLLAPLLFDDPLEYPIVLALLAFVAGSSSRSARPARLVDWALGLLPAIAALGLPGVWSAVGPRLGASGESDPILLLVPAGLVCLFLAGQRIRFGVGVAGLVFVGFAFPATGYAVAHQERTFFGIHRVYFDGDRVWLAHGTTIHGGQDSREPGVPLTYYHPDGPAGSLFRAFYGRGVDPGEARIGVVGLGTGSLIAYSRPGQEWTFFELDPTVARIAEDARYFIYFDYAWAPYRIVLGDARLSLEAEAAGVPAPTVLPPRPPGVRPARGEAAPVPPYDLLVVDAFSSDAIPVHLLTREAIALYRARLAPGGWIAFHVSNRYADFSEVLAALAADAGLRLWIGTDPVGDPEAGRYPSQWAVMAGEAPDFGDPRWVEAEGEGGRAWTDAYSSIFAVLRR